MKITKNAAVSSAQTAGTTERFWNMVDVSDDTGEIHIYGDILSKRPRDFWGDIIEGIYVSPEGFLESLETVKNKKNIVIKINSGGGDLYTGIAIHNILKGLPAKKTVIVEGIAASAASLIMEVGDEIQMYPGSLIMLHKSQAGLEGFFAADDLNKILNGITACDKAILNIYKDKTGMDAEALDKLLTEETWMTGEEAVEKGFATKLLTDKKKVNITISKDHSVIVAAGIRHSAADFSNFPSEIKVSDKIKTENSVLDKKTLPESVIKAKEDPQVMDLTELKKNQPDLVKQIENAAAIEAVKVEQARIKAIDEIASEIGDEQMIHDAKFGEKPMNAAELAFNALKKQKELGAKHLDNIKEDAAASKVDEVVAAPNSGSVVEDDVDSEISAIVNAVNGVKEAK